MPKNDVVSSRSDVMADMAKQENTRRFASFIRGLPERAATSNWSERRLRSPTRCSNRWKSVAADGFNVIVPYFPGGLNDFVDLVIPELQRRSLCRTEYESNTLRGNLGLPARQGKFSAATRELAAAS